MFIRETKTHNKKLGKVYIKHQLIESVRIDGKPRQRIIMNLGQIDLPRYEWKKLAHALECQLTGQSSLLETCDQFIEGLALSLVSNNKLAQKLSLAESAGEQQEDSGAITMDLSSIYTEKTRFLGAELVCQNIWDLLGFDKILKDCGFSGNYRSIAKALVFGRLISPGSELHTMEWFRKQSGLSELPGSDVMSCGKDLFYEIGDRLYQNKDKIEAFLVQKQQTLFPAGAQSVFLYDLTNTYMEGSCLGNELAAYGHCKSKRSDCPLITLSMIVRNDGMPVASHIYKGNQSEPETMEDMITRLETLFGYDSPQLVLEKPTVIMDRGIATVENVALLKEWNYPYAIVTRANQNEQYRTEFEAARDTFTLIDDKTAKRSVYGDINHVYVKRMDGDDAKTCKVLCLSDGKANKQSAIISKKDQRFFDDIAKLDRSIKKGAIKNIAKIEVKLKNAEKRHKIASEKYNTVVIKDDAGHAQGIETTEKSNQTDPLLGCYVIESTHTELNDAELWNLYMTQVHVEAAFRAMKGELGMRPVYHQKGERSAAHLFITVLGYHVLSAIEHLLSDQKDTRQWSTIREVLSTHTRSTVVIRDKDGNVYHNRVTGKPEDVHQDIYKKLKIKDSTKTVTQVINRK